MLVVDAFAAHYGQLEQVRRCRYRRGGHRGRPGRVRQVLVDVRGLIHPVYLGHLVVQGQIHRDENRHRYHEVHRGRQFALAALSVLGRMARDLHLVEVGIPHRFLFQFVVVVGHDRHTHRKIYHRSRHSLRGHDPEEAEGRPLGVRPDHGENGHLREVFRHLGQLAHRVGDRLRIEAGCVLLLVFRLEILIVYHRSPAIRERVLARLRMLEHLCRDCCSAEVLAFV